ncbi:CLUMA_CG010462, isoform A [Clunio marinus]|uniref:CLUMA_CG010462, isoform A n=1 Tax=Clunio marinus TaxID=568069 RepID=A0A1J1IBG1_9DIPT|nr:CLUMA_CG010462, isoform A [Clunio marinus]
MKEKKIRRRRENPCYKARKQKNRKIFCTLSGFNLNQSDKLKGVITLKYFSPFFCYKLNPEIFTKNSLAKNVFFCLRKNENPQKYYLETDYFLSIDFASVLDDSPFTSNALMDEETETTKKSLRKSPLTNLMHSWVMIHGEKRSDEMRKSILFQRLKHFSLLPLLDNSKKPENRVKCHVLA